MVRIPRRKHLLGAPESGPRSSKTSELAAIHSMSWRIETAQYPCNFISGRGVRNSVRTWSGTSYRVSFPYKKHVNTLSTLRVVMCAYFWMYTITGKKRNSVQSRVFQQCKSSCISLCASGAASAIREYLCVRVCNHRRGLTIIYIYIFLNILCISSYTVRYRETFLYIYKRHTHTHTRTVAIFSSRVFDHRHETSACEKRMVILIGEYITTAQAFCACV